MCIFKNKLVVVNNNNHGYFMDTNTGLKKTITFKFEKYPSNQQDKGKIV